MSDESAAPPAEQVLPVLPLKNTVLFPFLFAPYSVGRPQSVAAVEAALAEEEKTIVVVAQRPTEAEQPGINDLYSVGTRAVIKKMARASEETLELLVQGIERVNLTRVELRDSYLEAHVQASPLPNDSSTEVDALYRSVIDLATKAIQIVQPQALENFQQMLAGTPDALRLVFLLGSMLSLDVEKEQSLLECKTRLEGLQLLHGYLAHEVQVLELRQKITTQAQTEISKEQRDYLLRQQLRAIQEELGEKSPEQAEVDDLRRQLKEAELPEEVRKEAERSLGRLERLPPQAPDYQVARSHLELILELPWRKSSTDELDLDRTRKILDEDHFDLADIKQRILEHLAVLKLNPKAKAPILCFVGPPGVGKTSLGQSIARSMGRKFERMSLGGMHDEAELRGHRRTYIGAMPGRIIQAIRRAGVNNPMLMLDEVDKLGRDFRGDPASALLEILDPAQNHTFRDNYLDLPFDLSHVFFITTANSLDPVPGPLRDRLEILRLSGYTEEEKLEIAKRYLVPRVYQETGIKPEQVTIPDETIRRVIQQYTREAGCRQLERTLARLMRKAAVRFAQGPAEPVTITPDKLAEDLGPEIFLPETVRRQLPAGVATGLAWTEAGGDVLYIETTLLPHSHRLRLTGHLGAVMRESARTAQSFVWSHAAELGIAPQLLRTSGVHIHVPAGAVPKDGPSAGVALVTALTSLYTGFPVRSDTAMTGEISLSGLVLPVGGIKEKTLAARRAGLKRVILPRDNQKDMRDLPEQVRHDLQLIFAERIEEVLAAAIPDLHLAATAAPADR
ncbi:MAG TPA: endopeptidase La [Gemmataceae bacterium]|nr:endopeptidase La [Gemmataceae bacterium]